MPCCIVPSSILVSDARMWTPVRRVRCSRVVIIRERRAHIRENNTFHGQIYPISVSAGRKIKLLENQNQNWNQIGPIFSSYFGILPMIVDNCYLKIGSYYTNIILILTFIGKNRIRKYLYNSYLDDSNIRNIFYRLRKLESVIFSY